MKQGREKTNEGRIAGKEEGRKGGGKERRKAGRSEVRTLAAQVRPRLEDEKKAVKIKAQG